MNVGASKRKSGSRVKLTAPPGSALWKPCISRTFQPLTVHSRPPFPFTFCFLPPVNSGGAVGAVFLMVGLRDEHAAADRTAFQVPSLVNLRFQCPRQRQDRPTEPLTADRERNHLWAGVGVPVVKGDTIPVFLLPFSPKRLPAPFLRRVQALARSPDFGTSCTEAGSLRCFPCRGIPFQPVILFSRCCPPMNYPKSTQRNAILGILRELHFDEVYTLRIAFLQFFCIMEVC